VVSPQLAQGRGAVHGAPVMVGSRCTESAMPSSCDLPRANEGLASRGVTLRYASRVAVENLEQIAPLLERLKKHVDPLQVWLFGSRARGTHRPNSDWDILAVVPDNADDSLFDPMALWKLLQQDMVGADVLVWPKSEFDEDRMTPNSIPYSVSREGVLLSER